jgi:predicted acylesterase/phospholipase RssA
MFVFKGGPAMAGRLQCDIIMRGGFTSGIVYPRAIAKLAETYDFRSIGGSSTGAIAAAWTAAAALAAKRRPDIFQTRIKTHPLDLAQLKGGKTVYERLFQPQPSTRRLFNVFMASLAHESNFSKLGRVVAALYAQYPLLAFAGAVFVLFPFSGVMLAQGAGWGYPILFGVGAILIGLLACVPFPFFGVTLGAAGWAQPIAFGICIVLIGLLATTFSLLAATAGVIRDFCVLIPKNRFGVCSGSNKGIPDSCGVLPLTDWLHEFIQSLVDRRHDQPVTFGDLWNNGGKEDAEREIELVLMTTDITRGVSRRLPFLEGNWGQLFFREEDLAELFPPSVVNWMKSHAQKPRLTAVEIPEGYRRPKGVEIPEGYYGLPKPADLPILFGARMSASFPFFLSAIPLYAVRIAKNGDIFLERCWFSDGGIANDFPIHLFDAPIPSRPTFAINFLSETVEAVEVDEVGGTLKRISSFNNGKEDPSWDKVWMPIKNTEGITSAARFNSFTGVVGFLNAAFDTARNWADTELMAMPAYRDRIVHVKFAPDEGGINLNMPPKVIARISARGGRAGELLAARFAPNPGIDPKTREPIQLTWDNHRWIRYRSLMAAVEVLARRFRTAWLDMDKPWRSYDELLDRSQGEKPRGYQLERPEQYTFAKSTTEQFVNFAASWKAKDPTFDHRTPWPKAVLRVMPPGSNDPRAWSGDLAPDGPV